MRQQSYSKLGSQTEMKIQWMRDHFCVYNGRVYNYSWLTSLGKSEEKCPRRSTLRSSLDHKWPTMLIAPEHKVPEQSREDYMSPEVELWWIHHLTTQDQEVLVSRNLYSTTNETCSQFVVPLFNSGWKWHC